MNKQTVILILILAGFIVVIFMMQSKIKGEQLTEKQVIPNSVNNNSLGIETEITGAEKIEVVHFHASVQCWSCIEVGKLALETIEENFSQEKAKGIITFRNINGELPENQESVIKYQAGGSSLFVNAVKNGEDNITEDTAVWRYVSDEKQFKDYFANKLKKMLKK